MAETTKRQRVVLIVLSVFLALLILEVGLRVSGFMVLSLQQSSNIITGTDDEYRILCLGESTTANLLNGQSAWPEQLEIILNERSPGREFNVINGGVPGTTTNSIMLGLEENLDYYEPHMVITMMGINEDLQIGANDTEQLYYEGMDTGTELYYEGMDREAVLPFEELGVYKLFNWIWLSLAGGTEDTGAEEVMEDVNQDVCDEETLRKAIELEPDNPEAYLKLGRCYYVQGMFEEAEETLRKAVGLEPFNGETYSLLGRCYEELGRYEEEERILREAVELDPSNGEFYTLLGRCYETQGKYEDAEEMFRKAVDLKPEDDLNILPYIDLWKLYGQQGRFEERKELYKRAIENGIELNTMKNYREIYRIINERGIKLACMQYPMRDVNALKDFFSGHEDVIFISNEENFSDAMMDGKREDYFIDEFAHGVGHCTLKGNVLMAESAADVVLKELGIN